MVKQFLVFFSSFVFLFLLVFGMFGISKASASTLTITPSPAATTDNPSVSYTSVSNGTDGNTEAYIFIGTTYDCSDCTQIGLKFSSVGSQSGTFYFSDESVSVSTSSGKYFGSIAVEGGIFSCVGQTFATCWSNFSAGSRASSTVLITSSPPPSASSTTPTLNDPLQVFGFLAYDFIYGVLVLIVIGIVVMLFKST